jgi:cation diffusion facilitator CzcD-associated flavoprotein CzcO
MLETDYLIIGSGAVGTAFADTILTETDATIVIVDKLHQPGGHWNFAYPFVTLHQPWHFTVSIQWSLARATLIKLD